jgi:hypothetical protein
MTTSMYQKIVDNIISESFPKLEEEEVKVEEKDMDSKARARFTLSGKKIFVNKRLRKYSNKILKGLFVHELCHFKLNKEKRFGWFRSKIDIFYCYLSKAHVKDIETAVDKLAIKKGYKKDLLLTRKILEVRNPNNYLSEKQIKNKKFKK